MRKSVTVHADYRAHPASDALATPFPVTLGNAKFSLLITERITDCNHCLGHLLQNFLEEITYSCVGSSK